MLCPLFGSLTGNRRHSDSTAIFEVFSGLCTGIPDRKDQELHSTCRVRDEVQKKHKAEV